LVLVLVLCAGAGCTRQHFEPRDSIEAFSAYLDERVPRLMKQYDVPGMSMALLRDGKLVWSG